MNNRLEQLLEILKDEPDDTFTRYAIAMEYKSQGNIDLTVHWLEKLIEDNPDYVPTYYMLAEYYQQLQKLPEAEQICRNGLYAAKKAGDNHAYSELMALLDEIEER